MYQNFLCVDTFGSNLTKLRKDKGWSQEELAEKIGKKRAAYARYERDETEPSLQDIKNLALVLEVPVAELVEGKLLTPAQRVEEREALYHVEDRKLATPHRKIEYIELPYISIPVKANFAEMGGLEEWDYRSGETYRVPYEPGINIEKQCVFDVDGPSMEPYYLDGAKVRASPVSRSKWVYINSGVYVVVFVDFFVIKRIKSNSYPEGYFLLHSDNQEFAGTVRVNIQDIRSMWKVERVFDAPAR